jgi:sugar/nucleoside kinase (ribokinase family)
MQQAKADGLTISFDPNSDPAQEWSRDLDAIFAAADVLFLNAPEALAATRQRDIEAAFHLLREHDGDVVVKLGSKGAIGSRNGQAVYAPGLPIDAVDTTGAGDSFAAGFVHALLLGRDLETCLRMGNAAGALSTRGQGGTATQADHLTLEQFLLESR